MVTRLQQTQDSLLTNEKNAIQDRAATEEALQEAAIRLLDQHGVLAGLNLREVADKAGVNRGLVYHYFGSRAALLRRALRKTARARIGNIASARDMPFRQRMVHYWRTIVGYPREIRLVTLLLRSAEATCAARGVQLTPVRRRALEILLESHRALGAYDVLARLEKDGFGGQPPVAYRALGFLVDQGLAHRIERLNAFVACSHPGAAHDPAFMICRSCRKVAESDSADAPLAPAAAQQGFRIERMVLEAEGLCPACQHAGDAA